MLNKLRELLTHALFRYQAACLIYCLMSDHMYLMRKGLAEQSNQPIKSDESISSGFE